MIANVAWDVREKAGGTVCLLARFDDGRRVSLTLLPDEALKLGDTLIERADAINRRQR